MRNICVTTILFFIFSFFYSCDDGRIYDKATDFTEEGNTVKMVGKISGLDTWTSNYNIVLAGFNDNSEYAVTSANILMSSIDDNGNANVVMSGIKDDVTKLEICVINRIRERVVTFYEMPVPEQHNDTILIEVDPIDVSMFSVVQKNIFNSNCISCHGAGNFAAASLRLTDGNSYNAIVGKPSTINSNMNLVEPGSSSDSFMNLILNENGHLNHDHEDILSAKYVMLNLLKDWIDGGARQ